ncbi:hypothetical protein GEV49_07360 [Streptomyces sp. SYP-A7193]|nr:hypothetical protein GEV49_07360 [Streptomyces sp. SYP-A7193]
MRFWLSEGLWFAVRYPDTDVARKNLSLYVERLRDVTAGVARGDVPRSRGAGSETDRVIKGCPAKIGLRIRPQDVFEMWSRPGRFAPGLAACQAAVPPALRISRWSTFTVVT